MCASEYSTRMVQPRWPRRQPDAHGATSETEHPMLVAILGVLVIAHGLVTTAICVLPAGKDAPFDASHSWLLGDVRAVSVALGVFVGLAFVATGVGVLGHFGWWPGSAVIAGLAGVVLMVLWFNAWLTVGLAISVTVLIAGIRAFTSS
jgi:hypothetical protein